MANVKRTILVLIVFLFISGFLSNSILAMEYSKVKNGLTKLMPIPKLVAHQPVGNGLAAEATDAVNLQKTNRQKISGSLELLLDYYERGVITEDGAQTVCFVYCLQITEKIKNEISQLSLSIESINLAEKKIEIRVLLKNLKPLTEIPEVNALVQKE